MSSNCHYLLSIINSQTLKILGYGAILIFGVMGVVLDDSFAAYFGKENEGIVAIFAVVITCIFLGGAYRAFTQKETIEGYSLALIIAVFWIVLLGVYIRLLITPTGGNKR